VVVAVSTKRVALLASFAAGSSGLVVGAVAVVVTGCTAIDLLAFSRHFFLWARLPCPGPGMLVVGW
jgi:hypothetical protein